MIATLFKSNAEKLAVRLADLEDEAQALRKRAEDARTSASEAKARLVEDLAEGLAVDKWRTAQATAEKKAADAERDLAAAEEAAELVRGKLEEVRRAEALEGLRKRYAAAEARLPGVREDLISAGRAFSAALSRHEALRREENGVLTQLRTAGDQDARAFGVGLAEAILSEALGHGEGRERFNIDVPIWPSTGGAS